MRALICRTGSGSIPLGAWNSPTSPRVSAALPVHESAAGEKNRGVSSSILCLQRETGSTSIRRVSSVPSVILPEMELSRGNKCMRKFGSLSFPAKILEEDVSTPTLNLEQNRGSDGLGDWPSCAIPVEELGFPGGGMGKNGNFGSGGGDEFNTGNFGGGSSDKSSMGSYYEQMLKSDPTNALLLRNYGKYLQEVEKDFVKAEECYGRAILACPEDGDVLSLYGKLIWETQRDESRAKSYFDQSVTASPNDCTVLGSYAHFMWQADDDDEEEEVVMVSGAVKTMVDVCS